MKDYTKKSWNSLTQLKEHIERDNKEKIVSFDGIKLVTNKRTYRLFDGQLTQVKNS